MSQPGAGVLRTSTPPSPRRGPYPARTRRLGFAAPCHVVPVTIRQPARSRAGCPGCLIELRRPLLSSRRLRVGVLSYPGIGLLQNVRQPSGARWAWGRQWALPSLVSSGSRQRSRAKAEPGLVADMAGLCGCLPLVITLLADLFARHRAWDMASTGGCYAGRHGHG